MLAFLFKIKTINQMRKRIVSIKKDGSKVISGKMSKDLAEKYVKVLKYEYPTDEHRIIDAD